MINHDFTKAILTEEKKFLSLSDVKWVNVPKYDELSVKKFWPLLQNVAHFMIFMPDPQADQRLPDRNYFWNCLNTVHPDYVASLI